MRCSDTNAPCLCERVSLSFRQNLHQNRVYVPRTIVLPIVRSPISDFPSIIASSPPVSCARCLPHRTCRYAGLVRVASLCALGLSTTILKLLLLHRHAEDTDARVSVVEVRPVLVSTYFHRLNKFHPQPKDSVSGARSRGLR